jgi:hypothetical protein
MCLWYGIVPEASLLCEPVSHAMYGGIMDKEDKQDIWKISDQIQKNLIFFSKNL